MCLIIIPSVFRLCCKGRREKTEEKHLRYALFSEVVRVGGLQTAIVVRYSVIPAHGAFLFRF